MAWIIIRLTTCLPAHLANSDHLAEADLSIAQADEMLSLHDEMLSLRPYVVVVIYAKLSVLMLHLPSA